MCCSKYPSVGVTALYLLVFGIFSVNGIYVLGPGHVKLLSIEVCPDVETKVALDLNITDFNETAQLLTGTFYFPFLVDENFRISLSGLKFENGEWILTKTYIKDRNFCRIVDNYIWEMTANSTNRLNSDSMCPIVGGVYQIQKFSPNFDRFDFPAEMFGHVKFVLQIETDEEIYVCQEFEFENVLKEQELY